MKVLTLARKPFKGTVAHNMLTHGCGGINIDASRVGGENRTYKGSGVSQMRYTDGRAGLTDGRGRGMEFSVFGRWPANLILQHLGGCKQDGTKQVKATSIHGEGVAIRRHGVHADKGGHQSAGRPQPVRGYANEDGSETVANWACVEGCPVKALDGQSGERKTTWVSSSHQNNRDGNFMGALKHPGDQGYNDTGGASRFFKAVKP